MIILVLEVELPSFISYQVSGSVDFLFHIRRAGKKVKPLFKRRDGPDIRHCRIIRPDIRCPARKSRIIRYIWKSMQDNRPDIRHLARKNRSCPTLFKMLFFGLKCSRAKILLRSTWIYSATKSRWSAIKSRWSAIKFSRANVDVAPPGKMSVHVPGYLNQSTNKMN